MFIAISDVGDLLFLSHLCEKYAYFNRRAPVTGIKLQWPDRGLTPGWRCGDRPFGLIGIVQAC